MEDLKLKLIQSIIKTNDLRILNQIRDILSGHSPYGNTNIVAEEQPVYGTEKPMTDEEMEDFFMKMIDLGEEDVKAGRTITNEELKKKDEEWMKW